MIFLILIYVWRPNRWFNDLNYDFFVALTYPFEVNYLNTLDDTILDVWPNRFSLSVKNDFPYIKTKLKLDFKLLGQETWYVGIWYVMMGCFCLDHYIYWGYKFKQNGNTFRYSKVLGPWILEFYKMIWLIWICSTFDNCGHFP